MKEISFRDDVLPLKDMLYRLALRITLDTAEAEDVVQDTLIRVWEHRAEWDEIASLQAYSQTICRHLALDVANKAGHGNLQLDEDLQIKTNQAGVEEKLQWQEKLSLVKRLMDSLPEVQRTIMELSDIEGRTYQEIAIAMGLTETQVKVYLHRARTKIKTKVEEIEEYGL